MPYCLDANIFIQSSRARFPIDIFPVFWTTLDAQVTAGTVISIEEVRGEILKGKDGLADWAKARDSLFVANDDAATQGAMVHVASAVETKTPPYKQKAKDHFLDHADPWAIAFCKAHGHTLVTEETPAPDSLKSVKIPDIASAVGVDVINLNAMLRALKISFK